METLCMQYLHFLQHLQVNKEGAQPAAVTFHKSFAKCPCCGK